jgi:DNA ligase-1
MLKLKRYAQDEAMVLDVEQLYHNGNELELDERGYAKRSTHQENLIPSGKLGALVCRDLKVGARFNIGTGFNDLQRRALWADRANLVGRIVSYKHFAQQGVKDAPRHPVFVSFRDPMDL